MKCGEGQMRPLRSHRSASGTLGIITAWHKTVLVVDTLTRMLSWMSNVSSQSLWVLEGEEGCGWRRKQMSTGHSWVLAWQQAEARTS